MYNQEFYKTQSEGSLRSAQEVVPFIIELIKPRSVVDIGCGIGTWLSVYKKLGIAKVLGVDGDYVSRDALLIDPSEFISHDLTKPINIKEKFDLVQCVEVAEHLDPEFAEHFVLSLTKLGSVVAFAAAIPYQLGTGHVNEQFIDYWVDIFEGQGYYPIDCIRPRIWDNDKIEPWYRQNLILFVQEDCIESHHWMKQEREQTQHNQLSIVHPEIYQLRISMLVKVIVNAAHQLRCSPNRPAAEALYKLALHHDPEISEAWDVLGQMAAENGQYQVALEKMEHALLLHPTPDYYVNAGKMSVALGDLSSARKYLKKALQIEPGFVTAKAMLKKLKGL